MEFSKDKFYQIGDFFDSFEVKNTQTGKKETWCGDDISFKFLTAEKFMDNNKDFLEVEEKYQDENYLMAKEEILAGRGIWILSYIHGNICNDVYYNDSQISTIEDIERELVNGLNWGNPDYEILKLNRW